MIERGRGRSLSRVIRLTNLRKPVRNAASSAFSSEILAAVMFPLRQASRMAGSPSAIFLPDVLSPTWTHRSSVPNADFGITANRDALFSAALRIYTFVLRPSCLGLPTSGLLDRSRSVFKAEMLSRLRTRTRA